MKPNLGGPSKECFYGWSGLTRSDGTWCWRRYPGPVKQWTEAVDACKSMNMYVAGSGYVKAQLVLPRDSDENDLLLKFRLGDEQFIWIGCHFADVKGLSKNVIVPF